MKKILLTLSACVILFSCKQANTNNTPTQSTNDYQKLYDKSMAAKDYQSAITAVQLLLLNDSTNDLRDTLPELYGAVNNVPACLLATNETLKRLPNDEKFLNLKLLCLQEMGMIEEQFTMLQNLFQTTGKAQYIAQIAAIQVASGNLKEARTTIETILTKYKGSQDKLEVFVDERNKQQVPVEAAAWNMKGYIFMQQKNLEKAKECYFKALEIYPDFVMPKRNLDMIFSRK